MTFDEYQADAVSTISHSPAGWPGGLAVYHSLGVAEEAGEIVGKIKKALRRGTDPMSIRTELLMEVGDLLWYITALCHDLESSLDTAAVMNISKRADRQARGVIKGEGDHR